MKKIFLTIGLSLISLIVFGGTVSVNNPFALSVPAYSPPGIEETDQTISAQFNCGSPDGSTDVTANIRLKLIGNMVFATIPNLFCDISLAGSDITTQNSASPSSIPALFRPSQQQDFAAVWVKSAANPAVQSGAVTVTATGNISITYAAGGNFPGGVTGEFGFASNEQTIMWPVSGT